MADEDLNSEKSMDDESWRLDPLPIRAPLKQTDFGTVVAENMDHMNGMKYKEQEQGTNPQRLMEELGLDNTEGDTLGMGVIRKEADLSNEEKQYLLAVERGDMAKARNFLDEAQIYFNININCVDPLGRTALLIAIENENIEMIHLLLGYNVELGDAILHAISEENVEAVEMLLLHQSMNAKKDLSLPASLKPKGPKPGQGTSDEGYLGGVPSTSFTPDITPIILAAHKDNYEIIKILLDRGDKIPKPHDVRCSCKDCVAASNDDSLCHSRSRINAYRALASPSLIALSSKDPILTAFELCWELKRLSRLENEFKEEYEGLAVQCQDFATSLLEQTRGSKELQTILNHDTDGPVQEHGERMRLSRLKLAIKYKQKRFTSHPHCQQLLGGLWYEGLPGFRRRHVITKFMITAILGFSFPAMSGMYLIAPKTKIGGLLKKPFVKFIAHSSSYMLFLLLLIAASQKGTLSFLFAKNVLPIEIQNNSMYSVDDIRGAFPTYIEWLIVAWVAGFIWMEIKQIWNDGIKNYIADMVNLLDFITNSLYLATLALRVVSFMEIRNDEKTEQGKYAGFLHRRNWDTWDPHLISEGLFAWANIFSSLKLVFIFTINPHLGPLQISLGKMTLDVMKFALFYFLVLFAFACGMNQLLWTYAQMRYQNCMKSANNCEFKDKYFLNLFEIIQTLYWAIFGLIELESLDLKEALGHENANDHAFTEIMGKLMFGVYSAIAIIVLLNMLIAMMSNSYQQISEYADREWKFARSRLWMGYFEEGGTSPVPFNIIPSPKTFYYLMCWFKEKLCSCSQRQKRSRWQSIRRIVKKVNEREAKYQAVMKDLIKRYIMAKQRRSEDQGVTEDDLNEIKQDISAFRYELLEILRNNGMKTPQYSTNKPLSGKLRRKRSTMSFDRLKQSLSSITTIMEQEGDQDVERISDAKAGFLKAKNKLPTTGSNGSINGRIGENGTITETVDETSGNSGDNNSGELNDSFDDDDFKESTIRHSASLPPKGGFVYRDSLRRKHDRKFDKPLNEDLHRRRHSIVEENCDEIKSGDKPDEGLGSSLEQSENSDNGDRSQKRFDNMEDPLIEAEERPAEESPSKGSPSSGDEIQLDPTKLPSWPPKDHNASDSGSESPFNKKPGAIKRVSFLWGEENSGASEEGSEKSYVYDGKANGQVEPSGEKREKKFTK
ncbi:transient receptor potential-gamma protein-like isoform X2 [Lineus longissimus]|uniref:transient receptor potential-gamma protein-like isoform X2 n=1 Tax=Lineus longissimus TaxID=88925 RepID=UPI00315D2314